MNTEKPPIITCENFDPSKLTFAKLVTDEKRARRQYFAIPSYDHGTKTTSKSLIIQTPYIKLVQYGIPSKDSTYYQTDEQRQFIKVPIDPNQKGMVEFGDVLKEIDQVAKENKEKVFGSIASRYDEKGFSSLYKEAEEPEEEGKAKKLDFFKVKINIDYLTKNIRTPLYSKTGPNQVEMIETNTIDDIKEYVRYRSTIRMIIDLSKLWAAKKRGGSDKTHGLILRVLQIEVSGQDPGINAFEKGFSFHNENGVITNVVASDQKKPEKKEDSDEEDSDIDDNADNSNDSIDEDDDIDDIEDTEDEVVEEKKEAAKTTKPKKRRLK